MLQTCNPASLVVYWRWRKRGIKKRGGWVTAKFLSWDPSSPGKLAWVRSGTSTTLVAIEQLRAATGFEAWVPTEEEVQMLKDAAKSLDHSIWTDETGPPPPKRQLDEDEVDWTLTPSLRRRDPRDRCRYARHASDTHSSAAASTTTRRPESADEPAEPDGGDSAPRPADHHQQYGSSW